MSLLRRASVRHLLRHPAQLVLSVLGVALGVAVVVSIDLAIQSSKEAFQASAETVAGRATHAVAGGVGGVDDTLVTRLRVDVGVRNAAPVVEGLASSPALPGRALRILGVDPFSEAPFRPFLAGGSTGVDVSAFVTVPGAVALSSVTAAQAGVGLGDTLAVSVDGRLHALPVVGLLEPQGRLARVGLHDLLVLDLASAQWVLGSRGTVSRIDLRLPQGDPGEEVLARVRQALPPEVRVEAAGVRTETLTGMIRAFDLNLRALSLLALVFGMFLIYNAMTFSA